MASPRYKTYVPAHYAEPKYLVCSDFIFAAWPTGDLSTCWRGTSFCCATSELSVGVLSFIILNISVSGFHMITNSPQSHSRVFLWAPPSMCSCIPLVLVQPYGAASKCWLLPICHLPLPNICSDQTLLNLYVQSAFCSEFPVSSICFLDTFTGSGRGMSYPTLKPQSG